MSDEDFMEAAAQAVEDLPVWVRERMENIDFFVDETPSMEIRQQFGLEDPDVLLGLYVGTPLSERGSQYGYANLPDRIYLFRRSILHYCRETGEAVDYCVRHVVIHEVGHYLGLSDAEMEAIEREADV